MPSTPAELPSDVAALQAMVAAQAAELAARNAAPAAQQAELAAARAGIVEQRFEIEALKARLARALRATFGRRSEKLRDRLDQLELTLADIDELLAETAPSDADAAEPEAPIKAPKPARRPLPEALPRDVVEHAAPCHHTVRDLPRLRRDAASPRRGRDRDPGLRAGIVPRDPARAAEAVLPLLRDHHTGAGRLPADPPRPCRTRTARARAGRQILRPSAAAPPGRDLPVRTSICRARRWPTWWADRTLGAAPRRRAGAPRDGRCAGACRRHRGAGAGTGAWANPHGTAVDLCARRSAIRRGRPARRALPLLAGPQGRAPARASADIPRHPPSRWVCRVRRALRQWPRVEAACLAHARRKFWDVHEATKSPIARETLDRIAALYRIEDTIRGRPPDQRLRARIEHTECRASAASRKSFSCWLLFCACMRPSCSASLACTTCATASACRVSSLPAAFAWSCRCCGGKQAAASTAAP
jgi:transposase